MGLLALVLGVFGAVYFQGNGPHSSPQVAGNAGAQPQTRPPATAAPQVLPQQASAPSANKPQDQVSASPELKPASAAKPAPALPATSPQTAPQKTQNLPQIQTANVPPSPDSEAQRLSEISPTAAPADVASAAPRYWVEFGAYDTAYYADRLKQSLGQLGIDAVIGVVAGKNGKTYLRVRTSGDSDRATAAAQLTKAQSALRIRPLLHRVAAANSATPRAPEAQAKPTTKREYWVQFGAFRERHNARTMVSQLRKKDIQASVFEIKNSDLKLLYLVRASGLSSYDQARQTAQIGGAATRTSDAFIGQDHPSAFRPNPGLNPRAPTR